MSFYNIKERKNILPLPSVQAAQLFQGSKSFPTFNRDVTFTLIEHKVIGSETFFPLIIEVVSYSSSNKYSEKEKNKEKEEESEKEEQNKKNEEDEKEIDEDNIVEAQRLYLSCSKIFEKVNPTQLENEETGVILTPNCSYAQTLIVKYLFGRITLSEKLSSSSSTFFVEINPLDSDSDQDFKSKPYDISHEGPMILAQLPHIKNIR